MSSTESSLRRAEYEDSVIGETAEEPGPMPGLAKSEVTAPRWAPRGPRVLVTLPVYNEAAIIDASVSKAIQALTDSGFDFVLSIAEDGSNDGTKERIAAIRARNPQLVVQSDPGRHGRGWALRTLWSRIDADYYAFSDTDFAADPRFLVQGIRIAESGKDVVTGSRYVPGARVVRPPFRRIVSRGYNLLVRTVFEERVRDHQCGLKVFSRAAIRELLPRSTEDSWFWDTEMIVLAASAGFEIVEFPVHWVEHKAKRTDMLRLGSDLVVHGSGIVRLAGHRRAVGRPSSEATRAGAPDPGAEDEFVVAPEPRP